MISKRCYPRFWFVAISRMLNKWSASGIRYRKAESATTINPFYSTRNWLNKSLSRSQSHLLTKIRERAPMLASASVIGVLLPSARLVALDQLLA